MPHHFRNSSHVFLLQESSGERGSVLNTGINIWSKLCPWMSQRAWQQIDTENHLTAAGSLCHITVCWTVGRGGSEKWTNLKWSRERHTAKDKGQGLHTYKRCQLDKKDDEFMQIVAELVTSVLIWTSYETVIDHELSQLLFSVKHLHLNWIFLIHVTR